MEDYNFWRDFFDTYQSLSDGMKFAWLAMPPIFLLGLMTLIMRYRITTKKLANQLSGDLIYTIHRDNLDQLQIRQHSPQISEKPTNVMSEYTASTSAEPQNPNSKP